MFLDLLQHCYFELFSSSANICNTSVQISGSIFECFICNMTLEYPFFIFANVGNKLEIKSRLLLQRSSFLRVLENSDGDNFCLHQLATI